MIKGRGSQLLAPLLLHKLRPTQIGTVRIAGKDIDALSDQYLSKNIGIMPHNPKMFNISIG